MRPRNRGGSLRFVAVAVAIGVAGLTGFTGPAGLAPSPVVASELAADLTIAQAEQGMVALFNADRRKAGLPELVLDPAVAAVARARSTDMASRHYFSHSQPDGRNFGDLLRSAGISFGYSGEIIAWNNWSTTDGSMTAAHNGWLGSSGHRAVIHGGVYTRVGVGLAWDSRDRRWLWTGVFIDGVPTRDRVAPLVGVRLRPESGAGPSSVDPLAETLADGEAEPAVGGSEPTLASEASSFEVAPSISASAPTTEPSPTTDATAPATAPITASEPVDAPEAGPAFPRLRPTFFYHL